MARRKSSKIEPAELTFWLSITTPGSSTSTNFADLSQIASLLNRRFYRQGINWAVSGFETFNSTIAGDQEGQITISKLPNTWVMSNAWEKGFRAWQKMNNEALAESESVRPKFLDFKIYADSDHHEAGFAANLLPIALGGVALAGEWESSKFRIPDTTNLSGATQNREIIATGANYPGASTATGFNAVSLIEGYAASRALPDILDPNTPADAADADGITPQNWISALFNEGTQQTEDVLEDMTTENNIAPYPFENDGVNPDTMYPGGANQLSGLAVHEYGFITTTTVGNETNFQGGTFPCGLIRFDITNNADSFLTSIIGIRLVPGNHRGYLCEPMTEM